MRYSQYEIWREKCIYLMHLSTDINISDRNKTGLLKRWRYPNHYIGAEWYDYCTFLGRSRDSDELEESNFRVGLAELGGESNEDIVVVCENHWAVGWVEWIAIHKDSWELLEKAEDMLRALEDYSALDEQDYSDLQYENLIEYLELEFNDDENKIQRFLDLANEGYGCSCVDDVRQDLIDYVKDTVFLKKFPAPEESAEDDYGVIWRPMIVAKADCTGCDSEVTEGYQSENGDFVCLDCIQWEGRMIDESQLNLAL